MARAAVAPQGLEPGTVLCGKFRVERVLGRGGMGLVVEATHLELKRRVALKFLLPSYAHQPEAAERFRREARAAVQIEGEHVARVLDVGQLEDGEPYMLMELLSGTDLGAERQRLGRLPIADAVDYVIQAAEALCEAHVKGIVHRDVKPSNLFLTRRPDGSPLVKVLDFGISKAQSSEDESLTGTNMTIGTGHYMSPEQMRSSRDVDARTDVYSLGVTLFDLLAGRPPFDAESGPELCALVLRGDPERLRDLRPEVPDELARVVERAFARKADLRYPTVRALVEALAPFAPERSRVAIESVRRIAPLERVSVVSHRDGPVDESAATVSPGALAPDELELASTRLLGKGEQSGEAPSVAASTEAGLSKGSAASLPPRRPRAGRAATFGALALVSAGGAFVGLRATLGTTPPSGSSGSSAPASHEPTAREASPPAATSSVSSAASTTSAAAASSEPTIALGPTASPSAPTPRASATLGSTKAPTKASAAPSAAPSSAPSTSPTAPSTAPTAPSAAPSTQTPDVWGRQ
jgi:serine/threonine protein kinase